MPTAQSVSILLVIPGTMFMLASLAMCTAMRKTLPEDLRRKWAVMTYLILFFMCGYIAFLFIQLRSLGFPLELLTSSVFLGGAVFVFLVMRLTAITIGKVEEGEAKLSEANTELIIAYDSTIEGWGHALELRDKETEGHTQRVTEITVRIARIYGLSEKEIVHVRRGALLHDIGKMGIPDAILLKKGPLTPEEQRLMHNHPAYAFEMLAPIAYLRPALDIPYCHHEKWDGTGYPRQLKGVQIPLAARIFALADIWDALISERRYHEAWSRERVVAHLRSLSGSHFDPDLVELFIANV